MSVEAKVVRCAANAAAKLVNNGANEERELAFLDEKPSVGRRGQKGRRNSYLRYYLKEFLGKATIEKELVNETALSKKRRARLTGNAADEMAFSVPYSLNRKGRWQGVESAADLLRSAEEDPEIVALAGVDQHYGVGLAGKAAAFHKLGPDGQLESRVCAKPLSGANLASLTAEQGSSKQSRRKAKRLALAKLQSAESETSTDSNKAQVRYIIKKPHPVPQLFAGAVFKNSHRESWKSSEDREPYPAEDCLEDVDAVPDDDDIDMTASMAALYRAPRQSTFCLADFLCEPPPVFVQTKSIESLADHGVPAPDPLAPSTANGGAVVDERKLCKECIFAELQLPKAQIGVQNFATSMTEVQHQDEAAFRWLDEPKTRCLVDLTGKLDEHSSKMAMVVVVEALKNKEGFLRVFLNGSFGGPASLVDSLKDKKHVSPTAFLDFVVALLRRPFAESRAEKSPALGNLSSVFHGHQLAVPVEPHGDYKIIADCANRAPTVEALMIDVEEVEGESDLDDDMDDGEFEVIDMEDLMSEVDVEEEGGDGDESEVEIVPDFDAGCDVCPDSDEDSLVVLPGCGHRFCRHCLRTELTDEIVRKSAYPLTCLHAKCGAPVGMELLVTLVPLPLAQHHFRFAFMAEQMAAGKPVVECPHCRDLAAPESKPAFGSVKCAKCCVSFCWRCARQPHFPLSCAQMAVWEEKFDKQYGAFLKSQGDSRECVCGEPVINPKAHKSVTCNGCRTTYSWKSGEAKDGKKLTEPGARANHIAGEFSEICSVARTQRMDLAANRQITKSLSKSVDFRLKQGFLEIRKTALHLIEYGFAWLYLHRNDKPGNWSVVKAQLTAIRGKLDSLHGLIADGHTEGVEARINDLHTHTQKTLEEFAARD